VKAPKKGPSVVWEAGPPTALFVGCGFLSESLLLPGGEESDALPSNRDASTSGEVQVFRDLPTGLPIVVQTVADHLWHTGLIPVPVDLEAVGISHVQVVGGDEIKGDPVSVGADPLHHDGVETGLRVRCEDLGAGDFEGVLGVCGRGHRVLLGLCGWDMVGDSFHTHIIPLLWWFCMRQDRRQA